MQNNPLLTPQDTGMDSLNLWGMPNQGMNLGNNPRANMLLGNNTTPAAAPNNWMGTPFQLPGNGTSGTNPPDTNGFNFGNSLQTYGKPVGEVLGGIAAVGEIALGYGQYKQNKQDLARQWELTKLNVHNKGALIQHQLDRRNAVMQAGGSNVAQVAPPNLRTLG